MASGNRFMARTLAVGVGIASVALCWASPRVAQAQSIRSESDCAVAVTALRVATQATAAAVVTGVEYREMARQGSWHMAREIDRSAAAANPSSHLHALGSYRMARNLSARTCASASALGRSALRGAAMSLAIGAAKEVADGWYNGFSTTDLAIDAIGAGYSVAQAYVPALRHVTPSFSVAPRAFLSGRGPTAALTDYANQTLWLSANVQSLLPASASRAWPSMVRVSMGRRAYDQRGVPSEYVLGLDVDAAQLPGSHPAWMRMKQVLHNVRLPGPALVMSANGTRAFGLYW